MKSIRLTKNFRLALKAVALLGLIATLSAHLVEAQSQSAQQPSNRLITHPGIVKVLPSQNKRWALLIGVDRYEDSNIGALKGAANDANSLKDVLVNYAGFPEDQVVVLSTNEPPERQPTRKNILKRLSNLSGLVPKDGLLLVSFAGHGIERGGQAFLIPSDATLTEDLGLLEETAVAVNRVKERIKDTGVRQVMILLDACRAYPTGRSDSSNPLTPAFVNAFSFENRNREIEAFVVLYATAPGFRAYEYSEKHQGYFSWGIAQALKGAAANERGEVTLGALVKYLEDTVPKLVALDYGSKVIQKPFAEIGGYRADELVLSFAKPLAIGNGSGNKTHGEMVTPVERDKPQPAPAKTRGVKSGKIVIVLSLSEKSPRDAATTNILMAVSNEFTDPLASLLSKEGLSVTVPPINVKKLDTKQYSIILLVTLLFSDLAPYNGLNITEVNGSVQAIDTEGGKIVDRYNVSRVRGLGNSQDQAQRNALKNAADGISESFIKHVSTNAY